MSVAAIVNYQIAHTIEEMKADYQAFKSEFDNYIGSICWDGCRLQAKVLPRKLMEVYEFWKQDLARVEGAEPNLVDGMDHFKICGHLAYWMRRIGPIFEFSDFSSPVDGDEGRLRPQQEDLKDLLYVYSTEYLAFDWAFQICTIYEQERGDRASNRSLELRLSEDYIKTACHFMKCKHVSPHALALVLKSLFQ